jgi:Copper type II ascorbate-dependent monooxygenase, C-terminal domain/Copper type II ascorbate-dependent monooxygenase, N-terminal domain
LHTLAYMLWRSALAIASTLLTVACGAVDEGPRCDSPALCAPWGGDGPPEGEDEGDDSDDDESDDAGPGPGDAPGDGPGDGPGPADGDGLPCEVRDALVANCGMCHGEVPSFGAPMPLTVYDDLRVPAPSDATRSVYELVAERMTADVGMMPPDGNIADADAAIILDWIAQGAPEDPEAACGGPPDDGGEDEDVGPDALPCDAEFELTAHQDGNDQPYVVPTQGADDLYMCFAFQSPFTDGMQATAWAPIIDDERVVHHWILYRASGGNYTPGSAFPCDLSLQVSSEFVAGWAPGGGNVILPDDVGLELGGSDSTYVLQVHYNNSAHYPDAIDRSGVAFCATDVPRPNTAGVLTLGTTSINIPAGAVAHEETGTCGWISTIFWPELHIVATSPHMHGLGRGFRTVLERGNGGTEMVTDIPVFDFASQGMYMSEPEIVVQPGDKLHSTCVFDNPGSQSVGFGEGTGDEMCFNFVLAYPIDQLGNRNCGIVF